jgi:hypothetical protein
MTLSYATMGILALATLWTTAILVAGAAWQDLRDVFRLHRHARRSRKATILPGTIAEWRVEQRGRALDAKDETIAFHDRTFGSTLEGALRIDGKDCRACGSVEVWVTPSERAKAAACADTTTFQAAYAQAVKAAGWSREVRVRLGEGTVVHVLGELDGGDLAGANGLPLIVSSFDPTSQLVTQGLTLLGFIIIELVACAAVTSVSLMPPHLGPRSIVGAVLGLGFFLGVTPLGVALRERVRRPAESYLRGTWSRAHTA